MGPDIFVIDTNFAFLDLKQYVATEQFEFVVLDLETNSVSEKTAQIYGIGLSFKDNEAFYIPIRNNKQELLWNEGALLLIYDWIKEVCASHKLVGHNVIYDVLVFENNSEHDISSYIYSDTILLKHAIDEEKPFGLKEVSVKYLGAWADKAQAAMIENIKANGGSTTKDNMEMWKCDTEILAEYCGWDVLLTRKLFDLFEPRLKEEGLWDLFYSEETIPLYKEVTIPMKRHGFAVDIAHFKKLKDRIRHDIVRLENAIMAELYDFDDFAVQKFEQKLLDEKFPVNKTGSFPKVVANKYGISLPEKNGKPTLAKKELEKHDDKTWFYDWLLRGAPLDVPIAVKSQKHWYFLDNPDKTFVFNLQSNDHLGWLFFDYLQETPLSKTDGGKPQCDDEFLGSIEDRYPFVKSLLDMKRLIKLESTYIDGILDRQIDGVIYASMLMFGTTSGRFSCKSPNLQNIPRVKEDDSGISELVLSYANAIKEGFIAGKGKKLVNADYSALEPRCFAHMSGDPGLQEVFRKGYDLYSQIAIDVFGTSDCSADPSAPNYLKKKYPELRQKVKIFALACVYGANAGKISKEMGVGYQEADEIISAYLDAYPNLKKYMDRCEFLVTKYGYVKSDFGRVRHLPKARDLWHRYKDKVLNRRWAMENGLEEVRYTLKNALNLSKNHPIQALAAHIVNRAAIATMQEFKRNRIDACIINQVHDEITCVAREDQAEEASRILKECMENTTKISIPLIAEPLIGNTWAESK